MSETGTDPAAERQALLAALAWQIEAGADEAIDDAGIDRFALKPPAAPAPTPEAARPQARPAAPAAAPTAPAGGPPPQQAPQQQAALRAAAELNATARAAAEAAANLAELRAALEAFDGCALKKTATSLVFGVGVEQADVMFVGEAPGRDEDREGLPFVGASGRLLDEMVRHVGLDRETNFYVTNILPWRPPGNRNPTDAEIAVCMPFVERHIQLVRPKIVAFLGGTAAKTLLGRREGITKLRGRWYEYVPQSLAPAAPLPAMATLHPAYLLRQPAQKRNAWRDLLAIAERLDELAKA